MKATIVIDDGVFVRVKQEAVKQRRTISSFVETALRQALEKKPRRQRLKPLPTFHSGGMLVDISDKESLYTAMEDDSVYRRY